MAQFVERRRRETEAFGRGAEAAAYDAYGKSIRAGEDLNLSTPGQVMRHGAGLVGQGISLRNTKNGSGAPRTDAIQPATARPRLVDQAIDQLSAGARGAQDALTLGAGDHVYAAARAVGDAFNGQDIVRAYDERMAAERARDAHDAKYYPMARAAGQVAGTGLGLVALGPIDAALAGGVRIAQAAPMIAREAAVLGGLGAGAGLANQGLGDLQHRRLGSVGDYAGSAIGGATSALASARGAPGQAAALGGGTTSVTQDVLNGRPVSWGDAGRAALAGGYVAAPFGLAGRAYSEGLPFTKKGELGEGIGRVRTVANFDRPTGSGKHLTLENGKVTVLDQQATAQEMSEQKFGRTARLRPNQRAAYMQFGDRYRVDHFLPRDIGAAAGYPFGQLGYHQVLDDER